MKSRIDAGVPDEGYAGPNPGEQDEGHAGLNLEHMDLEATDVSTQPHPEKMDEGFITTAYPKVHDNLKLTVEEQVILEEPASSTGTLSSLQHLAKDFSFGDLFFNDKPSEADNKKTTAETEAKSMVSIKIQQDMSLIPPMTTLIIDHTLRPNSSNVHRPLQATATETTMTTTTTTHPPPPQPQQSTTDSMLIKRINELKQIMANLIQDNKHLEERLDSHGARLYTLENLDIPQQVSKAIDEIVTDATDWAIQAPLWNRFRDLPEVDMKDSSPTNTDASAEYKAWTMTNTRLWPSVSSTPEDLHMDDDMAPDAQVHLSDDEDIRNAHIPKNNWAYALASTYSPRLEDSLLAQTGDMAIFMDWFCKRQRITKLKPQDLEGPAFKLVKVFHPNAIHLQYQIEECHKLLTDSVNDSIIRHNVSKPLPLGGPPGQVNLRQDWWKPLKEERPATLEPAWSISSSDVPVPKNNWASALVSTYLPPPEDSLLAQTGDIAMFIDWFCKRQGITELKPQDLEGPAFELVKVFHPNVIHLQYQIEECHKLLTDSMDDSILRHNVSKPLPLGGPPGQKMKAAYYPDVGLEQMVPNQMWIEEECKHTSEGDRRAIWTYMRILSVVRIEIFSMYGYDYMKKIILRRADLNEHIISERDFKYLYPCDFEDLYLLNLQEDFQLGIESYQTQLNLTKPQWDAMGFEYKNDYMVIDSPRAVTFWDRYGVQMIIRFNEIHKKDVDRSKEFMFAIQKWLKTRRIFRNLESFVGGRVRDEDYRLLKRIE
nr:hypothetical protein [Tanacetum cinerariifolium]